MAVERSLALKIGGGVAAAVLVAGVGAYALWPDGDKGTPAGNGGSTVNGGPPVAAHGGNGATLRPADGGANYYAKFSPSLPSDPNFFPIAIWFESVTSPDEVKQDKETGANTYLALTDDSNLSLVRDGGMYAIHAVPNSQKTAGDETAGWLLGDEADMWGGPGEDKWTGKFPGEGDICAPADGRCGYSAMKKFITMQPQDKRLHYANYGKGVAFWESDAEAARFVNEFQDVVSVDTYFFTDNNICQASEGGSLFGGGDLSKAQCQRASNYGAVVSKVRSLIKPAGSKPVWGFVELSHPFTENDWPTIKPAQVEGAVWSSIIHGARGIAYFNHSFGGKCFTNHTLRDACFAETRKAVTALNKRITTLAPVLNDSFADGVLSTGDGLDSMVKWHDGHFYVFAQSNTGGKVSGSFSLPCVGDATVTVLDENRTVPLVAGVFTDEFADGNAVHVYRIDGGSSCGAS